MVKLLGGGSDLNTVVSDMNSNLLELKGEEVRKVFKDEQGTRVVVIDKDGLRTTAPNSGNDVMTVGNDDLTFNSANNTLKVVATDTVVLDAPSLGSTVSTSVSLAPYNLTGVPAVLAYVSSDGTGVSYVQLPYTFHATGASITISSVIYYSVTEDEVTFIMSSSSGAGVTPGSDMTIRYYILQETAN